MKRLPKKEEMKTSSIKTFFKVILIFLIILVIGILTLVLTNYNGYGDKIKRLVSTSSPVEDESVIDEISESPDVNEQSDSSLFKFNTHYSELDTIPWSIRDSLSELVIDSAEQIVEQSGEIENDLQIPIVTIEEKLDTMVEKMPVTVMLPQLSITDNSSTIDYSVTNRIIAIVGKNYLLSKNRDDQESVLLILAEPKSIKSISISNKLGEIIFSSDQKNLGKSLQNFFTGDLSQESIACDDGNYICMIPIYHTFGKLGYAMIMKADEKEDQ